MISNDRISRKHRPGRFKNRKTLAAWLLGIILAVLVIVVFFDEPVGKLIGDRVIKKMLSRGPSESPDSLAARLERSFMLNNPPEPAELSKNGSDSAARIVQRWPSRLSMMVYADRLRGFSSESGYGCDCIEYGSGDSLVCELTADGSTSAAITLFPDRNTELTKRSIGVILKNLYELDNDEILRVIDSRIPFGYLADIEVFPAGEIKKRLQSRWVSSILSIPTDKGIIARLGPSKSKRKGGKGKAADDSGYAESASDLLDRYPNLTLIRFERSNDPDYKFVESVLEQAKKKSIDYIYGDDVPDRIDSLAYGTGLSFINGKMIKDCTQLKFPEIKKLLLIDPVASTVPIQEVAVIDITKIKPGDFLQLLGRMRSIGIEILPVDKLNALDRFTVTDL